MGYSGVLGHEFVGVAETGPYAGRRVVGEINCSCGTCRLCTRGLPTHCVNRTVIGIVRHDGAFADYLVVPQRNLHLVPDSLPNDLAVFVEPVAAAYQILVQVVVRPEDRVIVSDVSKTPPSTIWESTGARFENAARGCIAYGESLSGRAAAGKAVVPLAPGQVYHVFLNLRRENPGDPTSGYEAEFCLKPEAGTHAVVHQVRWDKKLNRKSYEGCRAARQP